MVSSWPCTSKAAKPRKEFRKYRSRVPRERFGGLGGVGREALAAFTSHRTSGEPYSRRPYWRRGKLRLLSVQISTLFGPIRNTFCASDGRIPSARNRFDPPTAAVEWRPYLDGEVPAWGCHGPLGGI